MENTNVKENLEPVVIDPNEEVLVLKKPVMIDGREVKEIKYNVEKLTGASIEKAIKDLAKRKIGVVMPESDTLLHCQLFAYASNLDYTDIQRFSMSDYINAISIIRGFFMF